MSGERVRKEKAQSIAEQTASKSTTSTRRRHHWALLPFLGGVLIGLAISTAAVVRPRADAVTNIYINFGKRIRHEVYVAIVV